MIQATVKINGIDLWYQAANVGQKDILPLVLIHGWTASRMRVISTFKYFQEKGLPVFVLDLRGHGWSQKENINEYTIDAAAKDVERFIKDIVHKEHGFSQIILAGHSMGGVIVQQVAFSIPQRIKLLILLSTAASMFPGFLRKIGAKIYIKMFERNYDKTFNKKKKAHLHWGVEKYPMWATEGIFAERDLFPDPKATIEFLQDLLDVDHRENLNHIEQPTLIIVGENDSTVPPKLSKQLHTLIPKSELHIIPDCGHNYAIEKPDAFDSLILDFMRKHK